MKKLILSFLISLNVIALDDFDLYRYGPTATIQTERTSFIMKMVIYDSAHEIQKSFNAFSGKEDHEIRAFTQTLPGDDICYVHIVKSELWDNREALAILGHEVYHCTFATHVGLETINETKEEAIVDEEGNLIAEDRRLELENLDYECNNNTYFDYISGCSEVSK
jgi:hypothetical protein